MANVQEKSSQENEKVDIGELATNLELEEVNHNNRVSFSKWGFQAVAGFLFISYMIVVKTTFNNYSKIFGSFFFNGFRLILLSLLTICKAKLEKKAMHSLFFKVKCKWMIIRILLTGLSSSLFILMITILKLSLCTTVVMLTAAIQTTLGVAMMNKKITIKLFLGSFIAFFGLYMVIFDNTIDISFFKMKGYAIGILSIYFSSLVNYTSIHLIFHYDSSSLNFISNFWGGVISLIASYFMYEEWKAELLSYPILGSIVVSSIIYFLLYLTLNRQAPDSSDCCLISINHIQYPILLLIAELLFHENYSAQAYVGFVICFISSYFSATYLNSV